VSGADPSWFNATGIWATGQATSSDDSETCVMLSPSTSTGMLGNASCAVQRLDAAAMIGCCEVPVQPVLACPEAFVGPDTAGYCYRALNTTDGFTWDGANAACRALGSNSRLAAIVDPATGASVVTQRCAGASAAGQTFWTGICDTSGGSGHTNRSGSYWRNYGSGERAAWFVTTGAALWRTGEPNDFGARVPAENCVEVDGTPPGLNDVSCNDLMHAGQGPVSACCQAPAMAESLRPPSSLQSVSPTPSACASPSWTATSTQPVSPSGFPSATDSVSASMSLSSSPSSSATGTLDPTATNTLVPSPLLSSTSSKSASTTSLPPPSPADSASVSPVGSASAATAASPFAASSSLTLQLRLSGGMLHSSMAAVNSSNGVAGVLSAALPPLVLHVDIAGGGCVDVASARIACSVTASGGVAIFETGKLAAVEAWPGGRNTGVSIAPPVEMQRAPGGRCMLWPAVAPTFALSMASIWHSPNGGTSEAPLVTVLYAFCELHADTSPAADSNSTAVQPLASATARVLALRSVLPLPMDVFTLRSEQSWLESARLGVRVQLPSDLQSPHDLAIAVDDVAADDVVADPASTASGVGIEIAGAVGAGTLSGSTTLVLKLQAAATPVSLRNSTSSARSLSTTRAPQQPVVLVGGVLANVTYVAPDFSQIHIRTPAYAALCAATRARRDCGYKELQLGFDITNSTGVASSTKLTLTDWLVRWTLEGASMDADDIAAFLLEGVASGLLPLAPSIDVPPWWPPSLRTAAASVNNSRVIVPLAVPANCRGSNCGNSPGDAIVTEVPTLSILPAIQIDSDVPAALVVSAATGLYYTEKCAGYTDFASGACTNTSHPDFSRCGFGSGDACRPCPAHAICPGGWRAYPAEFGWYAAAESTGLMIHCRYPASARCLGWDFAAGAVRCGGAYDQQSDGCSACAAGFYQVADGSCGACPPLPSLPFFAILISCGLFAGAVAVCLLGIMTLAWVTAKIRGGTAAGARNRAIDLLVWIVVLLQMLAQAGQAAAPGLPEALVAMLQALKGFQLQDSIVPAACISGNTFAKETAILVSALCLQVVLLLLIDASRCLTTAIPWFRATTWKPIGCARMRRVRPFTVRLVLMACILMYALVCNTAFQALACSDVHVSRTVASFLYAASNRGTEVEGSAAGDVSQEDVVSISVLATRPQIVCYSQVHLGVAVVAWITVALFVIGFPLRTILWAYARIVRIATARSVGGQLPPDTSTTPRGNLGPQTREAEWIAAVATDATAITAFLKRHGCVAGRLLLLLWGRERALATSMGNSTSGRGPRVSVGQPMPVTTRRAISQTTASLPRTGSGTVQAASKLRGNCDEARRQSVTPIHSAFKGGPFEGAQPGMLCFAAMDRSAAVATDIALLPFVGDAHRASQFHARHVNLAGLAAVAAVQAFWLHLDAVGPLAARGVGVCCIFAAMAWYTWTRQPVPAHDRWRGDAQVGSLVVSILQTAVTHYTQAVSLGPANAASRVVLSVLGYVTLVAIVVLLGGVSIGFVRSTVTGAEREQRCIDDAVAVQQLRGAASDPSFLVAAPTARASFTPKLLTARARVLRTSTSQPPGGGQLGEQVEHLRAYVRVRPRQSLSAYAAEISTLGANHGTLKADELAVADPGATVSLLSAAPIFSMPVAPEEIFQASAARRAIARGSINAFANFDVHAAGRSVAGTRHSQQLKS